MARVNVVLAAFHRIAKQQDAIKSLERRLANREHKLLAEIGRALSDVGYRVERVDAIQAASPARRIGRGASARISSVRSANGDSFFRCTLPVT